MVRDRLTYGEKFETHPWKRIPIMEWERQDGLGWGFSYVYERSYALEHPFTAHLDASEEAGASSRHLLAFSCVPIQLG
eukprot:SAG31_NODE_181_length_21114_cov_99.705211_9_plen_78_part_00